MPPCGLARRTGPRRTAITWRPGEILVGERAQGSRRPQRRAGATARLCRSPSRVTARGCPRRPSERTAMRAMAVRNQRTDGCGGSSPVMTAQAGRCSRAPPVVNGQDRCRAASALARKGVEILPVQIRPRRVVPGQVCPTVNPTAGTWCGPPRREARQDANPHGRGPGRLRMGRQLRVDPSRHPGTGERAGIAGARRARQRRLAPRVGHRDRGSLLCHSWTAFTLSRD